MKVHYPKTKEQWLGNMIDSEITFLERRLNKLLDGDQTVIRDRISPPHRAVAFFAKRGYKVRKISITLNRYVTVDIEDDYKEKYLLLVPIESGLNQGFRVHSVEKQITKTLF